MEKDLKIRIKSSILALIVAGGVSTSTLPKTKAEDIQITAKQGSFIESNEDENYIKYVVKKGDCTSIISKKICIYYNVEITTKYWPVIAFLNNFPRVIRPGDIIIFPSSIEEMDKLLLELKANNWTSRYIQKNNIYGNNKSSQTLTVSELIHDIYGDIVNSDPNFVSNYLRVQELEQKYNGNYVITNTNELFELTQWIPTLEELGYKVKK